ncbi:MAG: hypothetical protein AAB296_04365, partial [Candidatus Desantisbacteria bacterium]
GLPLPLYYCEANSAGCGAGASPATTWCCPAPLFPANTGQGQGESLSATLPLLFHFRNVSLPFVCHLPTVH